ncbi:hypothetical protein FACS1894122_00210 [Alphaproteobacteria bacterium]|nr:hypothetical protein FACS1894122_00170 [Alphaproteobacteria bacterium]GHT90318.1 hypothetical protein FACS1894122_00210 [Alphaproteobacteria bacterium]
MIIRCYSLVLVSLVVALSHGFVKAKLDTRSVRDKLFKCHLLNKNHDKIFHRILNEIKLDKTKKILIPGIALCSIKGTNSTSKIDREMFVKSIAAVSNYVNHIIMEHRAFVCMIRDKRKAKIKLTKSEEETFSMMCSFYQSNAIDVLLQRIAPIPISLAVAQASLESNFGNNTSMHQKNAFFGMMQNRRKLLAFDTLLESVVAYAKTLNVNPRYNGFRKVRDKMLGSSQKIDGLKLASAIKGYAENKAYEKHLTKLIKEYNLVSLDRAYS